MGTHAWPIGRAACPDGHDRRRIATWERTLGQLAELLAPAMATGTQSAVRRAVARLASDRNCYTPLCRQKSLLYRVPQWTVALEPANGQPEGPLGRSEASWSSYLKSLTALSASMGEGGSADAVLKGIGVMADVLLRLLEGAWNNTFTLRSTIIFRI